MTTMKNDMFLHKTASNGASKFESQEIDHRDSMIDEYSYHSMKSKKEAFQGDIHPSRSRSSSIIARSRSSSIARYRI